MAVLCAHGRDLLQELGVPYALVAAAFEERDDCLMKAFDGYWKNSSVLTGGRVHPRIVADVWDLVRWDAGRLITLI